LEKSDDKKIEKEFKEIKEISDGIVNNQNSSKKETEPKVKNSIKLKQFIIGVLYLTFVLYFIGKYNFLWFQDVNALLYNLLASLIGSEGYIFGFTLLPKAGALGLLSLWIVGVMIYFNFLIVMPLSMMFYFKKAPQEVVGSNIFFEAKISLILIIPLIITVIVSGMAGGDFWGGATIAAEETQETAMSTWEKFLCNFNTQCLLQKQNAVDTTNTNKQDFSLVLLSNSYKSTIKIEDFADGEDIKFKYKVMSLNNAIKFEKLECYINNVRGDPVYTEILNELIDTDDVAEEKRMHCDLQDISSEDLEGDTIKVIPVLTYSIQTSLKHSIPIFKKDCDDMSSAEKRKSDIFENSNDAIKVEPVHYASMPITIGANCDEEEEYEFLYTIIKSAGIMYGKLKGIEVYNYTIPSIFETVDTNFNELVLANDEDKEEKAFLEFDLRLNKESIEKEYSEVKITMDVKTLLEKKNTLTIYIAKPLTDDEAPQNSNPEEVVIVDNSQTTNEGTAPISEENTLSEENPEDTVQA
jgi:hypothetical protein